jgi:hypothetical protein
VTGGTLTYGGVMKSICRLCFAIAVSFSVTSAFAGFWDQTIAIPSIETATVQGRNVSSRSLTPQQLEKLTRWFEAHKDGWRGLIETPPAPIAMGVVIGGPNGQQCSLSLFKAKDGTAAAYFYPPRPASPLTRGLSDADVTALLAAVEN